MVLDMKIASEKIDVELPKTMMVEIVDKAVPSARPVRPNKPLNIALGIIIGLVVGVGLAFFIEYLDTSVKTIDDVERSLQCPVLGVIPQNVGLLTDEGGGSPHAEAACPMTVSSDAPLYSSLPHLCSSQETSRAG